ncbi:MAG: hypothetical protein GW748_05235 [Alphaproteobacteria bacterium]|nr:hypothetical protein [Alphaproteobacteria bacterium]NCQ67130.1 hypothetical protein [Alphaproteobacteria bacterium]NCT07726.1 hypothetical protein [Alphaproteobacteria bacterium]
MSRTIAILSLLSLSACSTYQETFDCPVGEGVRCASLSTINTKMTKGEIQVEEASLQANTTYLGYDFSAGLKG